MRKDNNWFKIIIFSTFLIQATLLFSTEQLQLDLKKCLYFSLKNNKQLKLDKASLKIQRNSFIFHARDFFPKFSFGISRSDEVAFDAPDNHNVGLNFGIEQLIFDGGRSIVKYIEEKMNLEFTRKELLLKINQVIIETKNRYYEILLIQEREKIQAQLSKIGKIQEQHAELELSLGSISEVDYYDIKLNVKQIEIDQQKVLKEKKNKINDFKHFIGLDKQTFEIVGDIEHDFLDIMLKDRQFLKQVAFSNKVELTKSNFSLIQKKANYIYTIMKFIPEVSTSLSLGLTDQEFPPRNKSWSLSFNIKLPLPYIPINSINPKIGGKGSQNASRNTGNSGNVGVGDDITYTNELAQSRIDLVKDKMGYDELRRKIEIDIEQGIENYLESVKIFLLKQEKNLYMKKKLAIMHLRLELGEVKRVDLLEEEMNYHKSLIEEKQMLIDLINSVVKLEESIGIYHSSLKLLLDNKRKVDHKE